jgi:hypothetical protein
VFEHGKCEANGYECNERRKRGKAHTSAAFRRFGEGAHKASSQHFVRRRQTPFPRPQEHDEI